MVISVKSRAYFSLAEAKAELEKMKKKAKESGLERALCLLVFFGADSITTDSDLERLSGRVETDLCGKAAIVGRVEAGI